MSVSGSNQACIVIILVLTIPGSAALTVIPFSFTLSANSRVKSKRASFVFPYTGIRAKRPFFPLLKKSDSIRPMAYVHDINDTASPLHQGEKQAGKEVRTYVINTYDRFQAVRCLADICRQDSSVVHEPADGATFR